MSFNNTKKIASGAYQAPDCEPCPVYAGAIICDSLSDSTTEDWVYDDNEI